MFVSIDLLICMHQNVNNYGRKKSNYTHLCSKCVSQTFEAICFKRFKFESFNYDGLIIYLDVWR